MKRKDREKNIIHYGNTASILSVLSVVAAFAVVCIGVIYILIRLDAISVPGFLSGDKTEESAQSETEGQNLLDALTGSGENAEKVDITLDGAKLKSVLKERDVISPYAVTGTVTYSGDRYTKDLQFFVCVYGEKYRVDLYDGANLVRRTVYNGTELRINDGYSSKTLSDAEYFDVDAALPLPSIKRLCADESYEFTSARIEGETGNCICSGRFPGKDTYDEFVISTEYGIVTSAKTYSDGKLIYSCRIELITTNIPDPDSIINSPTI